jgi:hypothetical protein
MWLRLTSPQAPPSLPHLSTSLTAVLNNDATLQQGRHDSGLRYL